MIVTCYLYYYLKYINFVFDGNSRPNKVEIESNIQSHLFKIREPYFYIYVCMRDLTNYFLCLIELKIKSLLSK